MGMDITKLQELLNNTSGEGVEINIKHKLYGKQKLQCVFNPIINEHIGFNIKGHEIYINKKDIITVDLTDSIRFADNVMEINIKVL